MLQNNFQPQELIDSLGPFPGGMNAGVAPLILSRKQSAFATNITFRGTYARPRPAFHLRDLTQAGKDLIATALAQGPFQAGGYYNPDSGPETLIAAIAGRLFQFHVTLTPVTVDEITIPGDLNNTATLEGWMWQSEKWMIVNDGIHNPIFFDGTTSVRSNYNSPLDFSTTLAAAFVVPSPNTAVTPVSLTSDANLDVGDIVTINKVGTFLVQTLLGGNNVTLVNLTAQSGLTAKSGRVVSWSHLGTQLPPGRMGAYGTGRNWMCLVDGKQFIASDQVGGSSGTIAENYRDAVLQVTENNYLAGGGNFSVPGSIGDIRAMVFAAILDVSLGQGPLMVFTYSHVFSCQSPSDRLTWQDITNPILTESIISNGASGQNSTISANSDILFRSIDGIRSQILARRDFATWGNVPISREVDNILAEDSTDLLRFGSAIVFDNRLLMTARPVLADQGIYHRTLIALNFDPLSTLRGKEPSIYDGPWTALNTLQLVTGEFDNMPRAFAFTFNVDSEELEIYEIDKTMPEVIGKDNDVTDIVMELHSADLFNYPDNHPVAREQKRLLDGEIHVDLIPAGTTASFQVYYKPDEWPCFEPWFAWTECAGKDSTITKPQFRPTMGLGQPNPKPCDPSNQRPLREGYTFQVRIIFTNCRFLGARFKAITVPTPMFAPQVCEPLCPQSFQPSMSPKACSESLIILQPIGGTILAGQTFVFTVVAKPGSRYQWIKNGSNIAGATSANYVIPSADSTDTGDYSVRVKNQGCVSMSNAVSLFVESGEGILGEGSGELILNQGGGEIIGEGT